MAAPLRQYQGTFGRGEARHLLTRSGFGATPSQIDWCAGSGLQQSIGLVFGGGPDVAVQNKKWERRRRLSQRIAVRGEVKKLQAAWFLSAAGSPLPIREKIALFWHDHFATANTKVDDLVAMEEQMSIFIDHGLGSFRNLLGRVAKDPAMLVFLDGARNNKNAPNENFAREVFELFTLGIGNYTEDDIIEAARAFTGWQIIRSRFKFEPRAHDQGIKTVLGRTGALNGDDVLDLCLEQKACAEFLARKLTYYFLGFQPSASLTAELGECLRRHEFVIAAFLKELISSDLFFSEKARRGRIKSPIEFLLGVIRTLAARFSASRITEHAQAMGQEIYDPPGVAGWPNGRDWINSTTVVARNRFGLEIGEGPEGRLKLRPGIAENTSAKNLIFALTGAQVGEVPAGATLSRIAGSILARPEAQIG